MVQPPALPLAVPDVATEPDSLLSDILSGKGMTFEHGGKTYRLRSPTVIEWDDADWISRMTRQSMLAMPDLKELREAKPSEAYAEAVKAQVKELRASMREQTEEEREATKRQINELGRRSLADELAQDRATTQRDRYFVMTLLEDADSNKVFADGNLDKPGARALMEAARPTLWALLAVASSLPFGYVMPTASESP